jgi:hypothetical protein
MYAAKTPQLKQLKVNKGLFLAVFSNAPNLIEYLLVGVIVQQGQ